MHERKSESVVAQSCLTLSNPMNCSLPGSSIHGIFQARVLEWVAVAFSVIYALGWPKHDFMNFDVISIFKLLKSFCCEYRALNLSLFTLHTQFNTDIVLHFFALFLNLKLPNEIYFLQIRFQTTGLRF